MPGLLASCSSRDSVVCLFSSTSEEPLKRFSQVTAQPARAVVCSDDGALVASCGGGSLLVSSVEEGRVLMKLPHEDALYCCDFDRSSRLLIAGGDAATLSVWDVKRQRVVRSIEDHSAPIRAVRFDATGANVASGNGNGEVMMHRVRSRQLLSLLSVREPRGAVGALEFAPIASRSHVLGVVHLDGLLRIWDTARAALLSELGGDADEQRRGGGKALSFSPVNQKFVASTTASGAIAFWDVDQRRCVKTLAPDETVTALAFASERLVIAGLNDGTVEAYDLRMTSGAVATSKPHAEAVSALHFVSHSNKSSSDTASSPVDLQPLKQRPSTTTTTTLRKKPPSSSHHHNPPTPPRQHEDEGAVNLHEEEALDDDDLNQPRRRHHREKHEEEEPSRRSTPQKEEDPAASSRAAPSLEMTSPSSSLHEDVAQLKLTTEDVRRDIQNLHLDLIRQFQSQQTEIAKMLEGHSKHVSRLLEENEALRRENEALRNGDDEDDFFD